MSEDNFNEVSISIPLGRGYSVCFKFLSGGIRVVSISRVLCCAGRAISESTETFSDVYTVLAYFDKDDCVDARLKYALVDIAMKKLEKPSADMQGGAEAVPEELERFVQSQRLNQNNGFTH